LLDISMPVMDGIELLRRLDADRPSGSTGPAVIVLSVYDDFPLVRTAFTLGARDYILKTEIDADSLLALLKKTASGIEESRERTATIIERRQLDVLRDQMLRDLLAGRVEAGSEPVLASLGAELPPPFVVCAFWIRDFERVAVLHGGRQAPELSTLMERSLAQALARRGKGQAVSVGPGHAVVFFCGDESGARGFCTDALEYLERYLSVRTDFSLGGPCDGLLDVPRAYRAALDARSVESRIVVVARRYVHEHFADPHLSLADVAGTVGVSKNHFSWEFAREAGETFTEYLARVRIEEASRLLGSTCMKIYEVGERVGYPNVEHFSRVFKKVTGRPPSQGRRRQEQGTG
ncbi:MAG TPA: helix-turn-helix domain-containing protein, partial [Spirochaetia bacterium]